MLKLCWIMSFVRGKGSIELLYEYRQFFMIMTSMHSDFQVKIVCIAKQ